MYRRYSTYRIYRYGWHRASTQWDSIIMRILYIAMNSSRGCVCTYMCTTDATLPLRVYSVNNHRLDVQRFPCHTPTGMQVILFTAIPFSSSGGKHPAGSSTPGQALGWHQSPSRCRSSCSIQPQGWSGRGTFPGASSGCPRCHRSAESAAHR